MALAWIALNAVRGLGPVRIGKLLETYGSPENVLQADSGSLVHEGQVPAACVEQMKDPGLFKQAEKQLYRAREIGATILTLADAAYPPYLKEIFAPPPVLFVHGDVTLFMRHAVAMVGARSPTVYGKHAASSITRELIQRDVVIVSGLARGIDTVAHETALAGGGKTVAVLGTGIDEVYPRSNDALAKKIINAGALVSEFPLGTAPEAFNFPRRNRIISGLSCATVVVEAGEKSGSLITARYALQQGREVCAVPGPINSPLSMGTFNLIKEGATPVRSGSELADSLHLIMAPAVRTALVEKRCVSEDLFSQEERMVFNELTAQPQRIDTIADQLGKEVAELFVVLLNLELRGLVQQSSGSRFARV